MIACPQYIYDIAMVPLLDPHQETCH